MAVWKFKVRFVDVRECAVEADTEDEARRKRAAGEWLYEDTVDFYSDDLLEDLRRSDD